MRKRTLNRIILLVFISMAIYLIVLNRIDIWGTIGGNWTVITNQLLSYFPQLIGIGLGFILILKDFGSGDTTTARLLLITGLEGVFFASLFFELNNDGIWIDEIVTASFTIGDLQLITVLFFLLLGILIGLIKR